MENKEFNENNENEQLYIAIEKYLMLIMLEFQEHLGKYKNLYTNVTLNSNLDNLDVWKYKRILLSF